MLKSAACLSLLLVATAAAAELDQPTHVEIDPIKIELKAGGKLQTMAMSSDGNLLLGVSWSADGKPLSTRPSRRTTEPGRLPIDPTGPRKYALKIVSPQGKELVSRPLEDIEPTMLHGCDDGTVYILGGGKIGHYDSKGKLLNSVGFGDFLDGDFKTAHASGVTACDDYLFVAFGHGFSLRATEDVVRLNRDLTSAKLVVERQYGCCSHIDLDVKDNRLLIAENSRHRVNRFTFDGEPVDTWGRRTRDTLDGFAACCNPVNFDFGPGGVLYTAESGIGRIKKYTADGEFLGLVGHVDTTKFDRGSWLAASSCYIPVEVSSDGKRIFIMDVRANYIRVLEQK